MGQPKPLLRVRGRPLIAAQIAALAPSSEAIYVVLGAKADAVRPAIPADVHVVMNPDWARTHPADSLRLALLRAPDPRLCWVTPVDVPPPAPDTLARLLHAGAPAVPVDAQGRPGHPVLLDRSLIERVRERAPMGGLRTLLTHTPRVVVQAGDVARDFDDLHAFEEWSGG